MRLAGDPVAIAIHIGAITRLPPIDRSRSSRAGIVAATPVIACLWCPPSCHAGRSTYISHHGCYRILSFGSRGDRSNSHTDAQCAGPYQDAAGR